MTEQQSGFLVFYVKNHDAGNGIRMHVLKFFFCFGSDQIVAGASGGIIIMLSLRILQIKDSDKFGVE